MAENQEKVTRGVFYAFTRVILFVIAILVIALGFFAGMNSMNVNVIAKDAFAKRVDVALHPKEVDETALANLFTQDFITDDVVLNSTKYRDYTITGYYQRADVNMKIVWPWADRVVVHATENVLDIVGTINEGEETIEVESSQSSSAGGNETQISSKDKNPPEWICGEYEVTLVKDKDTSSWKVEEMKMIKEIEPKINAPSQNPSPSGSGDAQESASPSATASATPSASGSTSAEPSEE